MTVTEISALNRNQALRRLSQLAQLRRRVEEEMVVLSEHVVGIPKRGEKPPCSTERGYQWHRHYKAPEWPLPADDPCGCRTAHAAFNRAKSRGI